MRKQFGLKVNSENVDGRSTTDNIWILSINNNRLCMICVFVLFLYLCLLISCIVLSLQTVFINNICFIQGILQIFFFTSLFFHSVYSKVAIDTKAFCIFHHLSAVIFLDTKAFCRLRNLAVYSCFVPFLS